MQEQTLSCPFCHGQIVLTSDKRFGRVQRLQALPYDSWLVAIRFADETIEEYHSDLVAYPPRLRLVQAV